MRFRFFRAIILSLAISFFFFSCANSVPSLSSATAFLVCDFKSADIEKDLRLAVFAETENDVRRTDSIKITNDADSLEWLVTQPVFIKINAYQSQWTGYTQLVYPDGKRIPPGIYRILYTDATGKTAKITFSVNFSDKIYTAKISDFPEIFEENFNEKIAAFDEKENLFFYGLKDENWKTDKDIFDTLTTAAYIRKCYISTNSSVVCVMPPVSRENYLK